MNEENIGAQNVGAKIESNNQSKSSTGDRKYMVLAMLISTFLILALVGGSFVLASVGEKKKETADDTASNSTSYEEYEYDDEKEDDGKYGYGYGYDNDDDDNKSMDDERSDDVESIAAAITSYQTNNQGKTPLMESDKIITFVRRYIDATCSGDDDSGEEGLYTFGDTCSEYFRDPDGTEYAVRVAEVPSDLSEGRLWKVSNMAEMTYEITMISNAECGESSGFIKVTSSERRVAVLYRGEDVTICANNS